MSNFASKITRSTIFTVCIVYTTVCSRLLSADTLYLGAQGSKKTLFMDKPRACDPWKWTSPDFI